MDDPEFWKQLWDFFKSVVSDTVAPWVNRALPYLVSPTVRMVRTQTPTVRRVASNQTRDVMARLRGTSQHLRNPWLWPMFLALPVGIGMETTRWGATGGSCRWCAGVPLRLCRNLLHHPGRQPAHHQQILVAVLSIGPSNPPRREGRDGPIQ